MKPLSDYPRPQLQRDSYICLNGEWEYAITKDTAIPRHFDGKIIVPFSPETHLSGVNRMVHPDEWLFYKTKLKFPKDFIKDKVFLHFGAVDQVAEVFINDIYVGRHVGGFLPFSFEIRKFIKKDESNTLVVRVKDVTDTSYYSRGKQRIKRGNIWYSPQSGIYMPVWMESVSKDYIQEIKLNPDIARESINITVKTDAPSIQCELEGAVIKLVPNKENRIRLKNTRFWSPEHPNLYNFTLKTKGDTVQSYFAMREITTKMDEQGHSRIYLNGQPYFMKGVLDQGYYLDGFLTPTTDDDYIKDITLVKELGFNTIRKHIKIESLRWYYHCDRLGMLVWQDFVNGGTKYNPLTISLPLVFGAYYKDNKYGILGRKDLMGRLEAEAEFKDTIKLLYNCPCIVLWTIFNEAWGQFDAKRIYNELKEIDSTRLYDHASGWIDQRVSETKSLHVYFKRFKMPGKWATKKRAVILSECGGYALKIDHHTFNNTNFGYKKLKSREELENEYEKFINLDIKPNIEKGLCAFIYTQLSDVEDELNGFITYDRRVVKVNKNKIKNINKEVKY